jgi:MFS family permease
VSYKAPTALLGVLTLVNLLNYIDRQILFAIFPEIQRDLGLLDSQLGLAGSAFIVVYMLVTPLAGRLGDRLHRLRVVAGGVALWSGATVLAGISWSFGSLLAFRSIVGVGEACYAPLGSAMISDVYAPERRGWSLSIFNLAVPVGSALGYLLGGMIATHFGWRAAFFAVGAPGLMLALALLAFPEPTRGGSEPQGILRDAGATVAALARDPLYVVTTLSMAALTFVLGALAAWMPTFLVRLHGMSVGGAGATFGIVTALAGVLGTLLGGWLGDWRVRRDPRGHLQVSALGLLISVPFATVAIYAESPVLFWSATAIAEVLLFLNVGPLNAVILGAAAPPIRATAVAINILAIHVLGDALSPWGVGALSDAFGLRAALTVMPPMLLISAVLCWVAGRYVRPA